MKKFITLLLFLALGAFLTGCASKDGPTPEMTRMGSGSGFGSDNWVDGAGGNGLSPTQVGSFGPGGEGLQGRDARFNTDANAPENLLVSVYFDFDRSFIRESERSVLSDAARYLLENPGNNLLIEGHCDWKGTKEYNLALGDRRANSVKSYLIEMGIAPSRIEVNSKGDLEAVDGADKEARKKDRRADLLIL